MVVRKSHGAPEVYEVYDDRGESIGRVILPADGPMGRETGTVLLVREATLQLTPWR